MLKNLKIPEEIHTKLKIYCAKNKLSIPKGIKQLLEDES